MDISEVIIKISEIDALETWGDYCSTIEADERKNVFRAAERLWVERMARTGKLLVHPEVLRQLKNQSWQPDDLQKRMIWASVLASLEGGNSRERFATIKSKLLKKYGREWWEDVFQRKTNAWAAKERINKIMESRSSVVTTLINNTHLFSGLASNEREEALKMVPKV